MTDLSRGIISEEKPQQCDSCGKIDELRPYGKNGACICFDCMMKDEETAKKEFAKRLNQSTTTPDK